MYIDASSMDRLRRFAEDYERWRERAAYKAELKAWEKEHRKNGAGLDDAHPDHDQDLGLDEPSKLERLNDRYVGLTKAQLAADSKAVQEKAREKKKALEATKARIRAARPDHTAGSFEYRPLLSPDRQIRLLEVRVSSTDELYCTLEAYDLRTAPSFVAISYTWGSALDRGEVFINSRSREVRLNCQSALRQMTECNIQGWLWIDAVCINQDDNAEKAKQVEMMTTIFSQASWVAVVPQERLKIPSNFLIGESFVASILATSRETALQLLRDPFFTRIWTVQEVLVAKQARLIVERKNDWPSLHDDYLLERSLHLTDLESLLEALGNEEGTPPEGLERVQRLIRDILVEQKRPHYPSAAHVFRYLIKYDDLFCEEPRDRIFALMPMALRDTGAPRFTPDYNTSLLHVLANFVDYICALGSKQNGNGGSSFSDLLVCLMKLIQSFGLDLKHADVIQFFRTRQTEGWWSAMTDHESIAGSLTSSSPCHGFSEFQGICVGSKDDGDKQMRLLSITELPSEAERSLQGMLSDDTPLADPQTTLQAICHDSAPALLTTTHVQPGDVVLTPFAGPMAWTWNLVFRKSASRDNHFHLVSQAVPFKGNNAARLSRRPCCRDPACPAQALSKRVYLHADDVLSLALLSRAPLQRLMNPATTAACGSYAVLSGERTPVTAADMGKGAARIEL